MNKVSQISTETTLFGGLVSSLPIFICPAALYRLGHPDGEMNAVRAAGQEGIVKSVRPILLRSPIGTRSCDAPVACLCTP